MDEQQSIKVWGTRKSQQHFLRISDSSPVKQLPLASRWSHPWGPTAGSLPVLWLPTSPTCCCGVMLCWHQHFAGQSSQEESSSCCQKSQACSLPNMTMAWSWATIFAWAATSGRSSTCVLLVSQHPLWWCTSCPLLPAGPSCGTLFKVMGHRRTLYCCPSAKRSPRHSL